MGHKQQLQYINAQIERTEREGKRDLIKRLNMKPAAADKIIPLERRRKEQLLKRTRSDLRAFGREDESTTPTKLAKGAPNRIPPYINFEADGPLKPKHMIKAQELALSSAKKTRSIQSPWRT